jgi:phosphatidylglycerophosphatase A
MSATGERESSGASRTPDAPSAVVARKPRFAVFVATACGLGYLPKAPGTWGALGGVVLAVLPFSFSLVTDLHINGFSRLILEYVDPVVFLECLFTIAIAAIGVWSSGRAASFWGVKDPQRVVIDEVSGQHFTYLLGLAPVLLSKADTHNPDFVGYGFLLVEKLLNWKYLLLGFILFRVFDIWKPFPARQAESLPGGWGIMTDDWVAGIYAAIGLWVARAAGL